MIMASIQTFVFFDLETTGLIKGKIMPRITEIALIAVARKSICNSNKDFPPRMLYKLVIPVNPQIVISPKAESLTKLFNKDVQLLQPFNCNIYELIMHFLQHLEPPICFVAHNGNGFDYPILLSELERINQVLANEILCIDTWKMFQDFFKKKDLKSEIIQDLLNDEFNDSLSVLDVNAITEEIKDVGMTIVATTSRTTTLDNNTCSTIINNEKCNAKEKCDDIKKQSPKHVKLQAKERTPENQIIRQQNVFVDRPLKKNNPRKRLDFGSREKPVNYKLGTIYEYMFDSKLPNEHSAEADCLAMIRCVIKISDFFFEWSDNHAVPLINYKKT